MPFAHCRNLKKDCSVNPHPQPFSQWEKGERPKSVTDRKPIGVRPAIFAIRSASGAFVPDFLNEGDEMFIARHRLKIFRLSEVATPLPRGDVLSNHARRYKHSAPPERRRQPTQSCCLAKGQRVVVQFWR